MVCDTEEAQREQDARKRERASSTTTERPSGSKCLRQDGSEADDEEAPAQGTGRGQGRRGKEKATRGGTKKTGTRGQARGGRGKQ